MVWSWLQPGDRNTAHPSEITSPWTAILSGQEASGPLPAASNGSAFKASSACRTCLHSSLAPVPKVSAAALPFFTCNLNLQSSKRSSLTLPQPWPFWLESLLAASLPVSFFFFVGQSFLLPFGVGREGWLQLDCQDWLEFGLALGRSPKLSEQPAFSPPTRWE